MRGALAASTLLSGVLLGLAQGGPGESGEPSGSVAATDPGDDVCADCHPSIASSWAATGMARALDQLRPGELDGLVPVLEEASGLTYAFEEEDGPARIVETRGPDVHGVPHRDSAPLVFAIGAGELDRSFVALRDGRMWFAPLDVVGQGGERKAALAPAHAMTAGLRFGSPITSECLSCHTDRPPPRDFPRNLYPEPETWQPRGISCRACHAGAEAHVAWREDELSGRAPEGADPVLDPGSLGRIERMSICAACHLQGDARVELDPDRDGPPLPGGDLLERRAVFVAQTPTDEVGFVSQVERLVLSTCYLESGGARGPELVCGSCHDPHVSLSVSRERVRAGYRRCHASDLGVTACPLEADARAGRDCVDCHMRRTPVFDVAGVEIHDHWIRRRPGPPSEPGPLRFPESPAGEWRRFLWPGVAAPEHADDAWLWMMAYYAGGHLERAAHLVDAEHGSTAAALPRAHHVRGVLLEGLGREDEARRAYGRALARDPRLGEAMSNLGLLLGRTGGGRAGVAWLDRLLALHPRADGALRNRALVRRALGDQAGFAADLEAAMRLRPDAAVARALSEAHAVQGDQVKALRWAAEARRLDPLEDQGLGSR